MATKIYSVPSGQSLVIPAPNTASVCVQPGTGGTAAISYGGLPNGPFVAAPQGANTGVYSFCTQTYSGANTGNLPGMGNIGFVSVAATTAAAGVSVCDLSEYPGSYVERQTVAMTGVAFTTIASNTNELTMFSVRFPANYLQPNFRLEWEAQITLTNSVTVKTIKAYIGPSTNSATAAALEGGTNIWSNVYTSMIGARFGGAAYGRNDGQTIIASNPGLISSGGWGSSTTANVTVSTTNYNAGAAGVEQVFYITGTKATGTDTLTLDSCIVKVYQ
jgi:hypothetical protein